MHVGIERVKMSNLSVPTGKSRSYQRVQVLLVSKYCKNSKRDKESLLLLTSATGTFSGSMKEK